MTMGRPVKLRASYSGDAAYLTRLLQAIEADTGRPHVWRDQTMNLLRALISQLTAVAAGEIPTTRRNAG